MSTPRDTKKYNFELKSNTNEKLCLEEASFLWKNKVHESFFTLKLYIFFSGFLDSFFKLPSRNEQKRKIILLFVFISAQHSWRFAAIVPSSQKWAVSNVWLLLCRLFP